MRGQKETRLTRHQRGDDKYIKELQICNIYTVIDMSVEWAELGGEDVEYVTYHMIDVIEYRYFNLLTCFAELLYCYNLFI